MADYKKERKGKTLPLFLVEKGQDEEWLQQFGVYILFYGTGKIARVGKADLRPITVRLQDYDGPKGRWFVFRWIAGVPFKSSCDSITDLEIHLIQNLDPPENSRHRR